MSSAPLARVALLAFVAIVAPAVACKAGKSGDAVDASPAPSAMGSNPIQIPGAIVPTLPNMSLQERFAAEAAGRPPGGKPRVEDVYAALANGATVERQKQHLASPFGARYCVGARIVAANGGPALQSSVCEYASPDVATIGRTFSATGMSASPFRTVYANGSTTLTLREEANSPEADAFVARIAAAYAKL